MSQYDIDPLHLVVDHAAPSKALQPFWSATGYANADFTYTKPFLKMYDYLSSYSSHLKFMRLHNILSLHGAGDDYLLEWNMPYGNRAFAFDNRHNGDDKLVSFAKDGTLQYEWSLVDKVYDVIVAHNMVPIVEMVYLPCAIRKSDELFFVPADYKVYAQVVSDFVLHCQERYGAEALRGWYFEIWNEPDNEELWRTDPTSFFALYDYMENSIHSIDSRLRVGGPATMQSESGYLIFDRFLHHCSEEVNFCTGTFGTRLDFVSVHCKGGHPTDYNPSTNVMFSSVSQYLDILDKYPIYKGIEFFNDESDIIWAGNRGVKEGSWLDFRNTHYAPGFVCKMISLYCTRVQDRGINLAIADSDNAHLQWERSLFSGNRSQLTPLGNYPCSNLIKKPFFNAYTMLSRLGNERLSVQCEADGFDEKFGVLATRKGDTLTYLVWNFEDGISESYGNRTLQLELENIANKGKYRLAEYRIDREHSNSNTVWHTLGEPSAPSKKQITALREREDLELMHEVQSVDFTSDTYSIELSLPQHAVSLLVFVPENSTPPAAPKETIAVQEAGFDNEPQVFLKWTPNAECDFLYYRIMRKDGDAPYEILCERSSLNTATYTDMQVESGRSYTYKIVPINATMIAQETAAPVSISVK